MFLLRHKTRESKRTDGRFVRLFGSQTILASFTLSVERYTLTQLRYDLRKPKTHGLLERDGRRYAYRLTHKGTRAALLFLLFHQVCGPSPLAHSLFPAALPPNRCSSVQNRSCPSQGRPLHRASHPTAGGLKLAPVLRAKFSDFRDKHIGSRSAQISCAQ